MELEVMEVPDEPLNPSTLRDQCELYAEMWPSVPQSLLFGTIDNVSAFPFSRTTSSDIYKGYDEGTALAMKTFRTSAAPMKETLKKIYFEAILLSKLCHPNIIPFLGLYLGQSPRPSIVLRFMKHGALPEYLTSFPGAKKLGLLAGVADAVAYLHSLPNPVLHGDIRGMNVLVGDNGSPYLIDVGRSLIRDNLSLSFFPPENLAAGSPRWTAAEKLYPGEFPLTLKADVYSFACLCVEVFSGELPYNHLSNDGAVVVEIVLKRKYPSRPHGAGASQLTDELWSMLEGCFAWNPDARPSMKHVHRFIASQASTIGL